MFRLSATIAFPTSRKVVQHGRRQPDDRLVFGNIGGMAGNGADFLAVVHFCRSRSVRLDQKIPGLFVKPSYCSKRRTWNVSPSGLLNRTTR